MARDGWTGAFDIFDVFAYLVPGTVLIVPLALTFGLPAPPAPFDGEFILGFLAFAAAYLAGVALNAFGVILDGLLQKKNLLPSATLLRSGKPPLAPPLSDRIRGLMQSHFKLSAEVDDQTLWMLAFRYVIQEGLGRRVQRFLALSSMSRSLMLACVLEFPILSVSILSNKAEDTTGYAVATIIATLGYVLFWRTWQNYGRSMAQEVYLVYYVERVSHDAALTSRLEKPRRSTRGTA